jgi:hypothetical protein
MFIGRPTMMSDFNYLVVGDFNNVLVASDPILDLRSSDFVL